MLNRSPLTVSYVSHNERSSCWARSSIKAIYFRTRVQKLSMMRIKMNRSGTDHAELLMSFNFAVINSWNKLFSVSRQILPILWFSEILRRFSDCCIFWQFSRIFGILVEFSDIYRHFAIFSRAAIFYSTLTDFEGRWNAHNFWASRSRELIFIIANYFLVFVISARNIVTQSANAKTRKPSNQQSYFEG